MTDPLPYASPHDPPPQPLGPVVFGVVVRSVGLVMAVYGAFTLGATLVRAVVRGYGFIASTYFGAEALVSVAIGVALLRGEWLVRFAYGRR